MKDQWILSKQRNVNFFFKNGKGSPITFFGLYDLPQKALIINIFLATFIQNQKALSQKYQKKKKNRKKKICHKFC